MPVATLSLRKPVRKTVTKTGKQVVAGLKTLGRKEFLSPGDVNVLTNILQREKSAEVLNARVLGGVKVKFLFNLSELIKFGYSAKELIKAGYANGPIAYNCRRKLGFTDEQIRNYFKKSKLKAPQLKEVA